jgi:hypothetical protein
MLEHTDRLEGAGVRDLQVEPKPPDVTPSNFQTRH